MKRTRIAGMVLLLVDTAATLLLVKASTVQGDDYVVNPGGPILVLIVGGVIGLVALVLIIGPGSRMDPAES